MFCLTFRVSARLSQVMHGSLCVTLFSASDYCGDTGNLGAFMVFKSDMTPQFEQYMAVSQMCLFRSVLFLSRLCFAGVCVASLGCALAG